MLTREVLEQGVVDGTHIGAQIYVSRGREVLADYAVGMARPGVPMTTDSLMIWFSMTKAVTAVAVAQQWERGNLAKPQMEFDRNPAQSELRAHAYSAREAALSGSAGAGGGCGCY